MILQTWADVFRNSLQKIFDGLIEFLPLIIVAVVIFVLGWVVGVIIGRLVGQLIKAMKIDNALRSAGVDELFRRAGFDLDSGRFLGGAS